MEWDNAWKGLIEADEAYLGPLCNIDHTHANDVQQKELLDGLVQNHQSLHNNKMVSWLELDFVVGQHFCPCRWFYTSQQCVIG
jgi:hypothetical protein